MAIASLNSVNQLIFVMVKCCVLFEVRTEFLNIIEMSFGFKTTRRVQRPRPPQLFGKPIQWVETARYLGVTLDTRFTWSAHVNQVRKKAAQRLGLLSPVLNRRSVLLYRQLIRPMMPDLAVRCPHPH
jgi:hypothetical protein